ncbi:hypothetical protein GR183_11745 [Stappia sp. GBMRC 2046]|uniref:SGNH hydrolase-type esterase domain-containing protein n=1 Tax=Stappia sediminis TaxID=2692190 RepID=A0A7X3LUZ1_9HYPH|nr:GDSL-type esterase/lipase family protein [Stappia sediminis]MXN65576.1 hypothetical protein [Stappia sediminis]
MTANTITAPPPLFAMEISTVIDNAHASADAGRMSEAVRHFDLCRTMLSTTTDQNLLKKHIQNSNSKFRQEANKMKAAVSANSPASASEKVTIIADSLGLPRPTNAANFAAAANDTYPMLLTMPDNSRSGMKVDAHCQRFFTTGEAVELLTEQGQMVQDTHVFIHLGLNDCATRMFLEDQRIAIGLLPPPVAQKVLSFAKLYRTFILDTYPHVQYVPLERFVANLHFIANTCTKYGAKGVFFSTIILSPQRYWAKTPNMPHRFGTYNLAIMEAATAVGAAVLDVDRIIWEAGVQEHLDPDGMHLSPKGHHRIADAFAELISAG